MKVLSLFDGMSCGRIALQKAGIPCVYWASEIDLYAKKIAYRNNPDSIQLNDVRTVNKKLVTSEIDLLLGGSPCPGFSVAGRRLGFDDERSQLFFEYARCLNEFKPKYFLFENVRMKKEYADLISLELGVEPVFVNSSLVSAQNRPRFYWTNIPFEIPEDKRITLQSILESGVATQEKSCCIDAHYYKGGTTKSWFTKSSSMSGRRLLVVESDGLRKLSVLECERCQTIPEGYTEGVSNTQRYKMIGNGWTVDLITHILRSLK